MDAALKKHLQQVLKKPITTVQSVSGGSISNAYKITTPNKPYFVKTNTTPNALNLFKTEALSLKLINNTKTIKTPEVIGYGCFKDTAFLLLEFIETKPPSETDFKTLGLQLAKLHQTDHDYFGLKYNNHIGSLPQYNKQSSSWTDFYITQRLQPQCIILK